MTAPLTSMRYGPQRRSARSPTSRVIAMTIENTAKTTAAADSVRPRSLTAKRADQSALAPSATAEHAATLASSHSTGRRAKRRPVGFVAGGGGARPGGGGGG